MDSNRASTSETDSMEEMITCSICLEMFTKPKLLACQHSFCQGCLISMKLDQHNGNSTIRCPICNQFTPLPRGGVPDLRTDFRSQQLRDIIEEKNRKNATSSSEEVQDRVCDMCDKAKASSCCIDCVLCLCQKCLEHHNENDSMAEHCIEKMGDHMVCKMHNKRLVTLYCATCGSLCQVCAIKHDTSHQQIKLQVVTEHRKELLNTMDQLSREILDRRDSLKIVYEGEREKSKKAIKVVTAEIIEEIKRKETEYLKELDDIVNEALSGSDQFLSDMTLLRSDIKHIINGSPQTVFAAYDYLFASIQAIKNAKPDVALPPETVADAVSARIQPAIDAYRKKISNLK